MEEVWGAVGIRSCCPCEAILSGGAQESWSSDEKCKASRDQVYGWRLLEMTMWGWGQHSSQQVIKEKKSYGRECGRGAQKKNRIWVLATMKVNSSVRYKVATRLLRG